MWLYLSHHCITPICCCLLFCSVLIGVLQPGEDPFTLLRQEKRERIKGQQKQQLANVKQAIKSSGPTSVPATLRLAAALPTKGKGKPNKRKELRDEVRQRNWAFHSLYQAVLFCNSWLVAQRAPCTIDVFDGVVGGPVLRCSVLEFCMPGWHAPCTCRE